MENTTLKKSISLKINRLLYLFVKDCDAFIDYSDDIEKLWNEVLSLGTCRELVLIQNIKCILYLQKNDMEQIMNSAENSDISIWKKLLTFKRRGNFPFIKFESSRFSGVVRLVYSVFALNEGYFDYAISSAETVADLRLNQFTERVIAYSFAYSENYKKAVLWMNSIFEKKLYNQDDLVFYLKSLIFIDFYKQALMYVDLIEDEYQKIYLKSSINVLMKNNAFKLSKNIISEFDDDKRLILHLKRIQLLNNAGLTDEVLDEIDFLVNQINSMKQAEKKNKCIQFILQALIIERAYQKKIELVGMQVMEFDPIEKKIYSNRLKKLQNLSIVDKESNEFNIISKLKKYKKIIVIVLMFIILILLYISVNKYI